MVPHLLRLLNSLLLPLHNPCGQSSQNVKGTPADRTWRIRPPNNLNVISAAPQPLPGAVHAMPKKSCSLPPSPTLGRCEHIDPVTVITDDSTLTTLEFPASSSNTCLPCSTVSTSIQVPLELQCVPDQHATRQ